MKLFYIYPILIYSFIISVSEGIFPSLFRDAKLSGGGFQAAPQIDTRSSKGLRRYVEILKPGSNTTIGPEDFFAMA